MIDYPDISEHQGSINLDGAKLVVARSSIGRRKDNQYQNYKTQAKTKGIPLAGYHFLYSSESDPIADQVRVAFEQNGVDTPLMLDVERDGSDPQADKDDMFAFIDQYRAKGGILRTVYIPRWFWSQYTFGDISALTTRGVSLVNSNYNHGSKNPTSEAWKSFGGATPKIVQYTGDAVGDHENWNGRPEIDFNRFYGTLDELLRLFGFVGSTPTPGVPPVAVSLRVEPGVDLDSHGKKMKLIWERLLPDPLLSRMYITSSYRPGPPYHGALDDSGALDIAAPMTDQGARDRRDAAKLLYDRFGSRFLEIIHTTPFSDDQGFYVKNGVKHPGGAVYGDEVPRHLDHIHTAAREGALDQILAELPPKVVTPPVVTPPVVTPPVTPPAPDLTELKAQIASLTLKVEALATALLASSSSIADLKAAFESLKSHLRNS